MIYFPETIIQWDTVHAVDMLHYCCTTHNDTHSVHNHLLKPWWGRPPCFQPFSHLLFSPVQTQLMPIVHCWGSGLPYPKSGVPTPRVHAHPFPRARNTTIPQHTRTVEILLVLCILWVKDLRKWQMQILWLKIGILLPTVLMAMVASNVVANISLAESNIAIHV